MGARAVRGRPTGWTPEDAERIRQACDAPGGLLKLANEMGVAYSTLTKYARVSGFRSEQKKRPAKVKFTDPINGKFNSRPRPARCPEGEAIVPKTVKVQLCPAFADTRFVADPHAAGAGFLAEWKRLRSEQV